MLILNVHMMGFNEIFKHRNNMNVNANINVNDNNNIIY